MPEYMATGALLSAIDPVATLGVFGKLGVSQRLRTMVTGEAVVNDAVAIVLFRTFAAFMGDATSDGGSIVAAVFLTIGNLVGSAIVGMLVMLVCALTLKCTYHEGAKASAYSSRIQCLLLLLFSYLAFAVCEGMTLSGIVASLSAGLTASLYCANNMSHEGKAQAKWLFEILAAASESIVFFSVGLNISLFISGRGQAAAAALPLLAIVFCLVSRAVVVPPLVCCLNCRRGGDSKITAKEQLVMWHAGLRGAIAWALAIKFPSQNRDLVVLITTSVILFTTYVQGGSTGALLSLLGLRNAASSGNGSGKEYVADSDDEDDDEGETRLATAPGSRKQAKSRLPRWMRSLQQFHENKMQPLFTGAKSEMTRPLQEQGQRRSPLKSAEEGGSGAAEKSTGEFGEGGIRVLDSDEAAI